MADLNKLTVAELKKRLAANGLRPSRSENKAALVAKLQAILHVEGGVLKENHENCTPLTTASRLATPLSKQPTKIPQKKQKADADVGKAEMVVIMQTFYTNI